MRKQVMIWGYNGNGELGDGTTTNRSSPGVLSSALDDYSTFVSAGPKTTGAISPQDPFNGIVDNGLLYLWGQNTYGQLLDNTVTSKSSPYAAMSTMSSVSIGNGHITALRNDGGLWAWGLNNNGQIGENTTINRNYSQRIGTNTYTTISSRNFTSHAIDTNGKLWGWGFNSYGQIGDGTTVSRSSPVQVASAQSFIAITNGGTITAAISNTGAMWASGYNYNGALGNNSTVDKVPLGIVNNKTWKAVSGGANHMMGIDTNNTLWTWGGNSEYGQLGDNTVVNRSSPVQIGSANNWSYICGGFYSSYAITTNGDLYAWGYNNVGQLGDGTTIMRSSPVQVGPGKNWTSISTGNTNYANTVIGVYSLPNSQENLVWFV